MLPRFLILPYSKISIEYRIYKIILDLPFKQVLTNAGLDSNIIREKIINNNYNIVYNIYNNNYESIDNTVVIDPINVLINSLKNSDIDKQIFDNIIFFPIDNKDIVYNISEELINV